MVHCNVYALACTLDCKPLDFEVQSRSKELNMFW